MPKSFQQIYIDIQNQLYDSTSTGPGLIMTKQWINDSHKMRTNDPRALVFLESSVTDTTAGAVQFYPARFNQGKLSRVTVAVGTTIYSPAEAPSRLFWDRLNYLSYQSQVPYFFYIYNKKVGFYPTPSTTGNTITYYFQKKAGELSNDDTTGTVTAAVTSGEITTLTNSTTTWSGAMVGRFIQIPSNDSYWYEIATVPANNSLTLVAPISADFSAQTYAYTIGEMTLIPDGYEDIIEEDVLARHYRRLQDFKNAGQHQARADLRFEQLVNDKSAKTSSPYSSPQVDLTIPNINSFPSNLTGF
jgi:hypothetical protein